MTRAPAPRPPRRRRDPDRGAGVHPPGDARRPAGSRGAGPDGRQAARLRPRPRLARRAARASIATRPSPSSPAATCAGHGPASDRDLAKWAGPAAARRPRRPRVDLLRDRGAGGRGGPPARAGAGSARMPAPRLLGAFDPTLVGWSSREEIVGAHGPRIVSGGIFRPYAMVGGRAVGGLEMGRRNGSSSTSSRRSPPAPPGRSSARPRTSPASSAIVSVQSPLIRLLQSTG